MDEPTPQPHAADPDPDDPEADDRTQPHWQPADRRLSPGAVAFLGLGIAVGLCLAVTIGAGLVLDAWLHSAPVALLIGLTTGIVVAVAMAVTTIRRYL